MTAVAQTPRPSLHARAFSPGQPAAEAEGFDRQRLSVRQRRLAEQAHRLAGLAHRQQPTLASPDVVQRACDGLPLPSLVGEA